MRTRASLVVVLAGLFLGGCLSKATGHEGALTFAYAASVEVENFVKPIAPGAKLDVVALANGTEDELPITKAVSTAPSVLVVEEVRGLTVVLRGVAPGVADVEISAKDAAGNVLVDRMFFQVAKPAHHALRHDCTEEKDAVYVKGEDVDLVHGLATRDHRPVIGRGVVPVTVDPPGALDLVAAPQAAGFYRYRAPSARERIVLRSTVDGSEVAMRVVARGDLRSATMRAPARLLEGQEAYAVVDVTHGAAPVCNQTARTVARSLTPATCEVTAKLEEEPADENHAQLARITGLAFGTCELEVTLPELDGGRGVSLRARVDVGKVTYPAPSRDAAAPARLLAAFEAGWLGHAATSGLALGAFLWLRRRRRRR